MSDERGSIFDQAAYWFTVVCIYFLLVLKMPPNGPPHWLGPRDWRNRDTARR